MSRHLYSCADVDIDHQAMLALRTSGLLELGVNDDVAWEMLSTPWLTPRNRAVKRAAALWSLVGYCVLGASIYAAFTYMWWWFLIGFAVTGLIWHASKRGNSRNILDAALNDPAYYELARAQQIWIYQIDERAANQYKRHVENNNTETLRADNPITTEN